MRNGDVLYGFWSFSRWLASSRWLLGSMRLIDAKKAVPPLATTTSPKSTYESKFSAIKFISSRRSSMRTNARFRRSEIKFRP